MSIDFENNYETRKYINIRRKGPLINDLKEAGAKCLASDPTEGEAISYLLLALQLDKEDKKLSCFQRNSAKDAVKMPSRTL